MLTSDDRVAKQALQTILQARSQRKRIAKEPLKKRPGEKNVETHTHTYTALTAIFQATWVSRLPP